MTFSKRRQINQRLLFVVMLFLLLPFQNCGKSVFQVATESDLGSNPSLAILDSQTADDSEQASVQDDRIAPVASPGETGEPLALPRFAIDQLQYQGAFRLPAQDLGVSSVNFSYGAIGFNSDKNSLFVAGHEYHGAVAEFKIPTIVNSTNLSELRMATVLQNFASVVSKSNVDHGQGIRISGMHYSAGKLMVNIYRFYDQSPFLQTPTMILENANDIKNSSTKGYIAVQNGVRAIGWVSPVPSSLQAILGGTHIGGFTSSTGRAIIYNASVGPAAYSFNATDVMSRSSSLTNIPNSVLLNYSLWDLAKTDAELYNTTLTNKLWTHGSEASYGMIVPGTRSYLVLGGSGGHNKGMSYGDPPYGGYKGHYTIDQYDNYPYYWIYDVSDFEKVRKGQMQAKDVRPYAVGEFKAPFQVDVVNSVVGGTYDEANGILYLSLNRADHEQAGGTSTAPVIVAYKFNLK